MSEDPNEVSDLRTTDIIEMTPGQIRIWGTPIEDLIGTVRCLQTIWGAVSDELGLRRGRELGTRHKHKYRESGFVLVLRGGQGLDCREHPVSVDVAVEVVAAE